MLDWISSKKEQNVFVSNILQEIQKVSSTKQWNHIAICLNPADHGTRGLETKGIQQKWLEPPQFLCENEWSLNEMNKPRATCAAATRSSRALEPLVDSTKFSTWNKILLTVATEFNFIYRAKKIRKNNQQYTTEDFQSSRNYLLKFFQDNFFQLAIYSLQSGINLDSMCKIRC